LGLDFLLSAAAAERMSCSLRAWSGLGLLGLGPELGLLGLGLGSGLGLGYIGLGVGVGLGVGLGLELELARRALRFLFALGELGLDELEHLVSRAIVSRAIVSRAIVSRAIVSVK